MNKSKLLLLVVALSAVFLQACAPASYNIKNPSTSEFNYEESGNSSKLELVLNDNRPEDGKTFSYGRLPANLTIDGADLDPIDYLRQNVPEELRARGLDVDITNTNGANVNINKLVMRNHRVSGFSPFVTFTMLSADVETELGDTRLGIFIKRGKVPVWSFDEIVEPTFNEPLDILVKEFASKINIAFDGKSASDSHVQRLTDKITANIENGKTYLDVYQLGFTNNLNAIDPLVKLTKNDKEYIRQAAISSLGILKADDQLEYLISIAENSSLWADRGMALKAIGDIGNENAISYLKEKLASYEGDSDKNAEWSTEIIQLYLD